MDINFILDEIYCTEETIDFKSENFEYEFDKYCKEKSKEASYRYLTFGVEKELRLKFEKIYKNRKKKQKSKFIQASQSENLNLTIYDSCIVFNKLGFQVFQNYTKALIEEITDDYFVINLNNEKGCNINKKGTEPRLNIPDVALKFGIQKGKFRYIQKENFLIVDYHTFTEKYDNGIKSKSEIDY